MHDTSILVCRFSPMAAIFDLGGISTQFWTSSLTADSMSLFGACFTAILFPKIMIDQLGASLLIAIGGIVVREIRSAPTHGLLRH